MRHRILSRIEAIASGMIVGVMSISNNSQSRKLNYYHRAPEFNYKFKLYAFIAGDLKIIDLGICVMTRKLKHEIEQPRGKVSSIYKEWLISVVGMAKSTDHLGTFMEGSTSPHTTSAQ